MASVRSSKPQEIPHLRKTGEATQLIVDGKPFLILGGELQNSSLTSARYMDTVWQKMVDTGVNTLLGCVTWEDIEPVEGQFDFSELDEVLSGAAKHGMRLILLWFGSFKNGISTYTPAWVKTNPKRFPRAKLRKAGGVLETADVVSIFPKDAQCLKSDARAFGRLMRHLQETDTQRTVIMVQVENEVGLLGDSRDGSRHANEVFKAAVPIDLVEYLGEDFDKLHADLRTKFPDLRASLQQVSSATTIGNWESVFGKGPATDELFMAYHYAKYLNEVAAAGRQEYSIPLYTNVWQNYFGSDADSSSPVVVGGGGDPGDYPSGGGTSNVLDIWQRFAPNLDFVAPDVYLNDYASSCAKYRHGNQPLFIPEQRRDGYGARRIWKAFGSFQALGTSPFGIDTINPENNAFTRHYKLLAQVSRLVLDAQLKPESSVGFYFDELTEDGRDTSPPTVVRFGDFQVTVSRCFVFGRPGPGAGMLIHIGPAKFLLIGWGFQAEFKSTRPNATFTGILSMTEKSVVDVETGLLRTERRLNGDETRSGIYAMMPNEDPDYGGFPICVTIPARTMIAEVEVYALDEGDES
ncbi:glycoside hydrolase family 35 protein [Zymoseptoria brevis]|uniref:Glycoside hydrolase family 35 protein n=1 Tax=Zymoseptoria brevis TaxID=1047168 RepID=A0A0F4G712_9PEZI|nr:glycoside hydrolase family 35 protein [Zymoseptoria brevis]